jgi:GDPmannose 4,6-dehydratase
MYFASSGDCFGDTGDRAADEQWPFNPVSPYGTARCEAAAHVRSYRREHGLYACNGFTFAHESPLRPAHFVTQKIATSAARIAAGVQQSLELGSLDVIRDWGWAPEYVDGMHRMLQQPGPGDYVLATGRSIALESLVESAFRHFGLDWRKCVTTTASLQRPSDIRASRADPGLAARDLQWRATVSAEQAMARMCEAVSVKRP